MVGAAFNVHKLLALEALYHRRSEHDRFILACTITNARLAVIIQAPSPDLSLGVNGKGVVCSALDVGDFVFGETKFARDEAIHACTLNDATAKLVLLARAPSVDRTFFGKSEHMVSPANEVFDFFHARDEGGRGLDLGINGEAKNTFIALLLR